MTLDPLLSKSRKTYYYSVLSSGNVDIMSLKNV